MPVVGFDLAFSRVLADGKPWGDAGPYEELRGTLRFASDPANEFNAHISDIGLAPRNQNVIATSTAFQPPFDNQLGICQRTLIENEKAHVFHSLLPSKERGNCTLVICVVSSVMSLYL